MSRATELLEADGLYQAARRSNQSASRGYDFRPARTDPILPRGWAWAALAVLAGAALLAAGLVLL